VGDTSTPVEAADTSARPDLLRALGAWQAAAIVVGTIIGTGVFLKAAPMAQLCGSPGWVLAAWAVGGFLSLLGALSYAELGAAYPRAGGEYVFLREGYGPFVGYLYGWARFWIGTPASIAAYAVGAATFLRGLIGVDELGGVVPVAITLIVVFTAINCLSVNAGGWLQTVLTALKVVLILGLAGGALVSADAGNWSHLTSGGYSGGTFPGWGPFGLAILAALWAYDGWNNLPMAAGEVRDPGKNVPRAIVLGTLIVLAVYALINVAYFYALSFDDVATARSDRYPDAPAVAARVADTFLGTTAQAFLAFALTASALSAMTGSMLTGARVPFAMARDGLAPRRLAHVSQGSRAPVVAVLIQGGWASLLATSGRFDQLTDYVVFSSWLFYALNAGGVIRLRRARPTLARPYRVPLYPVVPLLFLVLSSLLLLNTMVSATAQSLKGIAFMSLAVPVYLVFHRRERAGG
jgi:APA family basic amino acid/polyamine antiporter